MAGALEGEGQDLNPISVSELRSLPQHCKRSMHHPWEKHLSAAIVLASVAFAVGTIWNVMGGAAIGAMAVFVALRPLFRNRRTARERE